MCITHSFSPNLIPLLLLLEVFFSKMHNISINYLLELKLKRKHVTITEEKNEQNLHNDQENARIKWVTLGCHSEAS